jgi:aspartate aminotransferase
MKLLSKRLDQIKPSATLFISQKARQLQQEGHDVISLSAGEPDFSVSEAIIKAAKEAMDKGFNKYTAVGGTVELKKAIIEKFKRENDLIYKLDEIIVTAGAKQALYNAIVSTVDEGDEVIILAPYWVSYVDMVRLSEGTPIIINCPESQGFKATAEQIAQHISPKTKWLILNSPNNPTGAVYSEAELKAIAEVVRPHPSLYIMSDDIYEHIKYTGEPFKTLLQIAPDLKERVLTINGVSKAYSMTGWRIGYAGGPAALIEAMTNVQSQSTSNPCSISQMGAVEALLGSQAILSKNCQEFQKRRDFVVAHFNSIPGLRCSIPDGAFYGYVCCGGIIGRKDSQGKIISNDSDFSTYLIDHAKVAVVPGEAFGMSPYFRVSYAIDMPSLEKALDRIEKAVADLEE